MQLKNKTWAIHGEPPELKIKLSAEEYSVFLASSEDKKDYDMSIMGALVGTKADAEALAFWGIQATSYESILEQAKEFKEPMNIYVDSFGGTVDALIVEASTELAKYKHKFHVKNACSAAYWLSCSGDITVLNELSIVGSIGVYCSWHEEEKMWHKARATKTPNKAIEPSESERHYIEESVDPMCNIFHSWVKENRVLEDKCLDGSAFFAKDALELNLIENIGFDNMSEENKKMEEMEAR